MPFKAPDKTSGYIRTLLKNDFGGVCAEIEEYAQKNFVPILLPETAAFLRQLILLKKPSKILEVGTAIGYSGIIMLQAAPFAMLVTIELREDYAAAAKDNLRRAGAAERATVFTGDAGEIVPVLDGGFDFIFLDGPKAQYYGYLPYLKKRLVPGGVLLCDNVLYNGMVTGEADAGKKRGMIKKLDMFLRALSDDADFTHSILPLGDGVSLSIKK
jgi:predicted O-methyltransferase YrrM